MVDKQVTKRTITDKDLSYFQEHEKCPICLEGELLGGACGGLSQNILCEHCCTEFTYSPLGLTLMAYDLERAFHVYGARPKTTSSLKPRAKLVSWATAFRDSWHRFWRGRQEGHGQGEKKCEYSKKECKYSENNV